VKEGQKDRGGSCAAGGGAGVDKSKKMGGGKEWDKQGEKGYSNNVRGNKTHVPKRKKNVNPKVEGGEGAQGGGKNSVGAWKNHVRKQGV